MKRRPKLKDEAVNWPLDGRITVVLFAGMGGACDGLEAAGFPVHLAINHDKVAVAVHKERHPHTEHLMCDVFEADPRVATRGRAVRILWASPDCTHHSLAKGSKPVSPRRRSLTWVVCRWAGTVRPEVIGFENVAEIQTWGPLIAKRDRETGRVLKLDGSVAAKSERVPVQQQQLVADPKRKGKTWRAFLQHLDKLGYRYEFNTLVCANYGVPTIRKRLFGVMLADGGEVDWMPRTHAPRTKAKALGLAPWEPAWKIIDWTLPVKSIFDRKKSLAEATLRRTARGVMRYVVEAARPFIVPITHSGADRTHSIDEPLRTLTTAHRGELSVVVPHIAKYRTGATGSDVEEPMPTITANSFEKRPGGAIPLALVGATLVQTGYGERQGQAPRTLDIEEPAGTQVAGGPKIGLVAAFLGQHNDGPRGHFARDVEEPVSTLTVKGSQQTVAAVSLTTLYGTTDAGRSVEDPAPTFSAGGNHAAVIGAFLQTYYSSGGQDQDVRQPLGAATSKARHGLVTVRIEGEEHVITDIGMRMLEPEEGAAAHEFTGRRGLPEFVTIDGQRRRLTKTEKYHLVGNSVPWRMVKLIAERNVRPALLGRAGG